LSSLNTEIEFRPYLVPGECRGTPPQGCGGPSPALDEAGRGSRWWPLFGVRTVHQRFAALVRQATPPPLPLKTSQTSPVHPRVGSFERQTWRWQTRTPFFAVPRRARIAFSTTPLPVSGADGQAPITGELVGSKRPPGRLATPLLTARVLSLLGSGLCIVTTPTEASAPPPGGEQEGKPQGPEPAPCRWSCTA
jgi:hypothetical protein